MEDILNNEEETILSVNEQYCIGCGLYTRISPDNFAIINKKAKSTKKILKSAESENIRVLIDKCPAKAI